MAPGHGQLGLLSARLVSASSRRAGACRCPDNRLRGGQAHSESDPVPSRQSDADVSTVRALNDEIRDSTGPAPSRPPNLRRLEMPRSSALLQWPSSSIPTRLGGGARAELRGAQRCRPPRVGTLRIVSRLVASCVFSISITTTGTARTVWISRAAGPTPAFSWALG